MQFFLKLVLLSSFYASSGSATINDFCLEMNYIGTENDFARSDVDWDSLVNFLKSKRAPRSIDDLMSRLNDHLDYWTGVYQSESAQADYTSPARPRIISFGRDGKLILTYASCPDINSEPYGQAETLEVMRFDNQSESFILNENTFPGVRSPENMRPIISEDNPKRCLHCHGNPVKPIWHPYNFWPGVFGSISGLGLEVTKRGSKEHVYYQKFLEQLKDPNMCSRYKLLRLKNDFYSEFNKMLGPMDLVQVGLSRCGESPNDALTKILSKLNIRRALRELTSHFDYPKYKFALAGTECFDSLEIKNNQEWVNKFFPSNVTSKAKNIEEIEMEIESRARADERTQLRLFFENSEMEKVCSLPTYSRSQFCPIDLKNKKYFNFKAMARIQFVLNRMGLNIKDWGISKLHRYSYLSPDYVDYIFERLKLFIPEQDALGFVGRRECNELANKSQSALK